MKSVKMNHGKALQSFQNLLVICINVTTGFPPTKTYTTFKRCSLFLGAPEITIEKTDHQPCCNRSSCYPFQAYETRLYDLYDPVWMSFSTGKSRPPVASPRYSAAKATPCTLRLIVALATTKRRHMVATPKPTMVIIAMYSYLIEHLEAGEQPTSFSLGFTMKGTPSYELAYE